MKDLLKHIILKRITLTVFLLFIAAIVFIPPLRHKIPFLRPKKPIIETVRVAKKTIIKTVEASGKIKAEKEVNLKFQTSGKLAWVGVKEGDTVKKWQAIASLDKQELRKKLKKELNDYMNERWSFDQDHDDYPVVLTDEVKRILEKAQFDLNNTIIDVEIADLTLKLATIVTPIEGIVTHIDIPIAGTNITPATATFTVADPEELIFGVDVDEIDIGTIKLGQRAQIFLDSYPEEKFEGEVKKVSFVAKTTRGGGTAFEVEINLPLNTPEQKFKLGMNGDITIEIEKRENALVIPSEAIMKRQKKFYVFAIKDEITARREVRIGLETETETEILEGITEGEKVVSKNLSKVKEGQKVK
jgi:RND family efflux transporter MFP subunit